MRASAAYILSTSSIVKAVRATRGGGAPLPPPHQPPPPPAVIAEAEVATEGEGRPEAVRATARRGGGGGPGEKKESIRVCNPTNANALGAAARVKYAAAALGLLRPRTRG